ncbi:putative Nitroreductase family protein (NADH dehydrogenase/NAD(P)H nitroreductase) [Desulfamplus magnetovallimortis]|uniref:Putative Nitroreductase family protein (NADH dehydrogenase/NAD(P)H nitroreductase) n=1 Tax=Desulfamplus magnetovallimortis TaxID=1246637 RepID=A0A1W1HB64_9BACT|nr:nitroreductase family protein [Desulfamplus magnetovallimortis]SLM29618.1 putative Nitroreductase family protein (NADH dehydrogenase/NAD(P)H nitroreductase) [Desulfamplus magnetovallimortis]
MSLISIDIEKCVKDSICAAECPVKIIDLKNGFPEIMSGGEVFCINCGHCVAVCPTAAISHKKVTPEDCLEIREDLKIETEQAEQFFRQRRSIRTYKKKPVEKELLEKAITLASHAPSGHNRQPVNWHVIYDREELVSLCAHVIDWMKWMIKEQPETATFFGLEMIVQGYEAGVDLITRDTPHLILAHGHQKSLAAQPACIIAMTWLELSLPSFGLGGCWCGFFNSAAMFWPPLQKALGLPEGHMSYGAMMVGYPKYAYHRMPPRNAPKITGL